MPILTYNGGMTTYIQHLAQHLWLLRYIAELRHIVGIFLRP